MTTVNLDIGPNKRNQEQSTVNCYTSDDILQGYKKCEYKNSSAFTLSGLSYGGQKFTLIVTTPIQNVSKVLVYFKQVGDKLLAIHVSTNVKHYYYTNYNISNPVKKESWFDEFVNVDNSALDESTGIKEILDSVVKNKRLYYDGLSDGIKEKLWKASAVVFQLDKKPSGDRSNPTKYNSDTTDAEVSVTPAGEIGIYPKIQHTPNPPFYIKGIKNTDGGNIDVPGGFPNDGLNEFNVHYGENDNSYKTPLLVTLNVKKDEGDNDLKYISSKYYISRTEKSTWEIRRISGSNITDKDDIPKILKNISENGRLYIEILDSGLQNKLKDLTEGLTIKLEEAKGDSGTYDSNGKKIPYKRIVSNGYTSISHADTFISFTIKGISADGSTIEESIIPIGTRLSRLRVFYSDTRSTDDPLLIFFLKSNLRTQKWISRHYGDTTWQECIDSSLTSDTAPGIKTLLETLSTPKVAIDISQYAIESYNPTGNILYFKVESTDNPAGSDFWKFEHTWSSKPFTVKGVMHGNKQLKGIEPSYKLTSISAFFSGNGSSGIPLLVELVSEDSKYSYYQKERKDADEWTLLPRNREQTDQLDDGQLKPILERLKKEHIPAEKSTTQKVFEGLGGTTAGGFATAEAVNFTLDTGWSVIRRALTIFNTAV